MYINTYILVVDTVDKAGDKVAAVLVSSLQRAAFWMGGAASSQSEEISKHVQTSSYYCGTV